MRIHRHALAVFASLLVLGVVSPATADYVPGKDKRGWGDKYGRLALGYSQAHGTDGERSYIQQGVGLDIEAFGFFEQTHFGTLIGAELGLSVAARNLNVLNDASQPEGGHYSLFARAQAAIDFSFLHWDGSVPGRFVVGGGGGTDWDGERWFGKGRAYSMLLGKFQWRPHRRLRMHLGYQFLPMTTGEASVQEHRFELAIAVKGTQAGVRHQRTSIVAAPSAPLVHEQQTTLFLAVSF